MDRTQKRCLVGSVFLHGTLIALLIAGAAFAPKQEPEDVPFLVMLPPTLKVTDGNAAGGGNPNAQHPPQVPPMGVPPPATPPVTPPAKPVAARRDTPPPTDPMPTKRAEPKAEPTEKPEKKDSKTEKSVKNEPKSEKTQNNAKSQDVDPTRAAKKPIQLAGKSVRKTDSSEADSRREREAQKRREREEQEAREAQEAADRRNRAIDAANSARRDLARALTSGAQTISSGVGSASVLEIPGPGGQAYAPYISYLGAFYRERWRKPRAVSGPIPPWTRPSRSPKTARCWTGN